MLMHALTNAHADYGSICLIFDKSLFLQSRSYFQGFLGLKLLNGCLVVLPSNLYLQGIR